MKFTNTLAQIKDPPASYSTPHFKIFKPDSDEKSKTLWNIVRIIHVTEQAKLVTTCIIKSLKYPRFMQLFCLSLVRIFSNSTLPSIVSLRSLHKFLLPAKYSLSIITLSGRKESLQHHSKCIHEYIYFSHWSPFNYHFHWPTNMWSMLWKS